MKKGFRKATDAEKAYFNLGKLVGAIWTKRLKDRAFELETYKAYRELWKFIDKNKDVKK